MRILLISSSAPPKNSPESVQVGRYLQGLSENNEVVLLTASATGGWEPEDETLLKYIANVRKIVSLPVIHPKVISLIRRVYPAMLFPDESFYFGLQSSRARSQIGARPDIIISRSGTFSSALLARKLSISWSIPWIMHLSDPWADNPFIEVNANVLKKHHLLELQCFNTAHAITLTSRKTIQFYERKYPHFSDKLHFLPNVYDDELINQKPLTFDDVKLKIVFTGRLYGTRSINPLIKALQVAVAKRPDLLTKIEVLLAGFFDEPNTAKIRQSELPCLQFLGAVPMEDAIRLQQDAAVLVVIDSLDADKLNDLFFPSKLLDYFAARRKIIALTSKNSTTYDVVEGKYGTCFYSENMDLLPSHLIELCDAYDRRDRQTFEVPTPIEAYSAAHNAIRLQELVESVVLSND